MRELLSDARGVQHRVRDDLGQDPLALAVAAGHLVADHEARRELDDALALLVDDAVVVGGHDHRRAGRVDAVEELHDADRRRRVEVSGRLVGQQDRRAVHEGAGDGDALLLTTGELVRAALLLAVQADHLQDLGHGGLDDVARAADHLERERDVLVDRLVGKQAVVLEDHADRAAQRRDLPAGQAGQVAAGNVDLAARRALLAQREPQERRLARAGRPDEEHELAARDVHGHVVQGGPRAARVHLRHVLEADHRRRYAEPENRSLAGHGPAREVSRSG